MSSAVKRSRAVVLPFAEELRRILAPSCVKVELAGSLRRETREVGDVELVAIPKVEKVTKQIGGDLFGATQTIDVNRLWEQLDLVAGRSYTKCGDLYRQFAMDVDGGAPIKVDVFTARPETWGWIYLIRTGSADFSHWVAKKLNEAGYTSKEGAIHRGDLKYLDGQWKLVPKGDPIKTPTEQDVFDLARIQFRDPKQRGGGP